jgi:hypothetical protein
VQLLQLKIAIERSAAKSRVRARTCACSLRRQGRRRHLASAHLEIEMFADAWKLMAAGEHDAAPARWRSVADLTRLK